MGLGDGEWRTDQVSDGHTPVRGREVGRNPRPSSPNITVNRSPIAFFDLAAADYDDVDASAEEIMVTIRQWSAPAQLAVRVEQSGYRVTQTGFRPKGSCRI